MKLDLNSHILDTINSAIQEKVKPSIKNAVGGRNSAKTTKLDRRLEGPHPSNFSQAHPQRDFRSHRPYPESVSQAQDAQNNCPRLVPMSSNRINYRREKSVDSNQSDDDDGYDTFIVYLLLIMKNLRELQSNQPFWKVSIVPY